MTDHADNLSIPDTVPTVSMQVVQVLIRYAKDKQIDLEGIPLKVYLTEDNTEARLPVLDFNHLWSEVARRADDPNFGLHFGEVSFSYPAGNLLLSVLMNCRTLDSALWKLSRYHGLTADYVLLQVQKEAEVSFISWNPTWEIQELSRHHTEAVMTNLRRLVHGLTGDKVRPVGVEYRHDQPADISEHKRIFDCPVTFSQPANQMLIKTSDLDTEIFLANPTLLKELEQIAQDQLEGLYIPDTWAKRVSTTLSRVLINGEDVSLDLVASELAISPRDLQIKLKEEGTTYQEILESLRKEMALRYLTRADISIFEVAFLLGYSEQRAFNQVFIRWTGLHPQQYQQQSLSA